MRATDHALFSNAQVKAVVRYPQRPARTVRFRYAARRQHHAVTDCRHWLLRIEETGDMALQNFTFEVFTHATRTMSARQQQRIERGCVDGIPSLWREVVRIDGHVSEGRARGAI